VNIEFNTFKHLSKKYGDEYKQALNRVVDSAWYILGNEVISFEEQFASYCKAKHCIGLNSGLDALILSIRALGIGHGDEIIVPANTYIATVLSITENHAIPVFVEPDEYYCLDASKIELAITKNTKAILSVHLFGQACDMTSICDIAKRYGLFVIEDCAQSHAVYFNGQMTGTFGTAGCFSFYPTKNLGALGDAGAVVTNNDELTDKLRMLRNYGSKVKYYNDIEGVNSRMDEMQAAILSVKLSHLSDLTSERVRIANKYLNSIKNNKIILPKTRDNANHVYHLFVIRTKERDKLQQYLLENGIKTQIHYPIPPHLANCYKYLGYKKGNFPITEQYANESLSLPLYNGMSEEEIDWVIEKINEF